MEQITHIVDPDQLTTLQTAFRRIVGPRYANWRDKSDTGSQLLHKRLQRFLIVVAKDQRHARAAGGAGSKVVGLDGKPVPSAAVPARS